MKLTPIALVFIFVEFSCQTYPGISKDIFYDRMAPEHILFGQDFALFVTSQESLTPVSFNFTFTETYAEFLKTPKFQLTLNPGEVRIVAMEVKYKEYLKTNSASLAKYLLLEVISFQPGLHDEEPFKELIYIHVNDEYKSTIPLKNEVVVQLDKDHQSYKAGMELNYRVLLMKSHSQLLHKPLLITSQLEDDSGKVLWSNQTAAIGTGILIGSAKIVHSAKRLRVTAQGQDGFFQVITKHLGEQSSRENGIIENDELKLKIQVTSALSIYNAKLNVTVSMFRSSRKIPVAGSCSLSCTSDIFPSKTIFKTNFTLNWATGSKQFEQLEVNITKNLKPFTGNFYGWEENVCFQCECVAFLTGQNVTTESCINIYKNISEIEFLSNEIQRGPGEDFNYVVLTFKIVPKDDDPTKEKVKISLELSEITKMKLTNKNETSFSKDVLKSGIVVLQFPIKREATFTNGDKVSVRCGNAEQSFNLNDIRRRQDTPKINILLANPEQVIRAGEKTKFVVVSDHKLDSNNTSLLTVMHSQKTVYENKSILVHSNLYLRHGSILVAEFEMIIPPPVTTLNKLYLSVIGSCIEFTSLLPDQSKSEAEKRNTLVLSARMKIGEIDQYGPVRLEKAGIWEKTKDLSTQVTFEIFGNLEKDQSILGTLETHEFYYRRGFSYDPLSFITILPNGNKLDETNEISAPEIDKIHRGFVDFPLSSIKNGTITVTKVFDRVSQSGQYSLKAMVIKSSGEVFYTNEIRFTISSPPISLSFGLLPYSLMLGETIELEVVVRNNIGVPYEGNFSMELITLNGNGTIDSISTGQTKVVQVKENSMENILFKVTPPKMGKMKFALKSVESNKTMVTSESTLVLPFGRILKVSSKSFHVAKHPNNKAIQNITSNPSEFSTAPDGCKIHSSKIITRELFEYLRKLIEKKDHSPNWTSTREQLIRETIRYRNTNGSIDKNCDNNNNGNVNVTSKREKLLIDTSLKLNELFEFKKHLKKNEFYNERFFDVISRNFDLSKRVDEFKFSHFQTFFTKRREFNISGYVDTVISSGVRFLKVSISHSFYGENSAPKLDNLPLSLVALLFSNLGLKDDAKQIINILDVQLCKDSSGSYWTSTWNSFDTCQSQSADLKPSVVTTAFALLAYVKVKDERSEEIAKWLVSNYFEEKYKKPSSDDLLVTRALDAFADFSETIHGERPVIITNISEYICPFENITGNKDFTVKTNMSEGGKLLVLEVCRVDMTGRNISLEVTFPSGFAYGEIFLKPYKPLPYPKDHWTGKPKLENVYLSNKDSHLFHVPDPLFLSLGNCWNILAYRKVTVYFYKNASRRRSFGWVAIHSTTDNKKYFKYF